MLASAAGEAIGAASCARAGNANAAAKKAAERTERVRFIIVDRLGLGGPSWTAVSLLKGIAIAVPWGWRQDLKGTYCKFQGSSASMTQSVYPSSRFASVTILRRSADLSRARIIVNFRLTFRSTRFSLRLQLAIQRD